MNSINVILTLASPLYVAYPDNVDKTANVSRTTKAPLHSRGRMSQVPIYPANGFRGGLRRKAADLLAAHFKANEGPITGDFYLGLTCGASDASPDKTPLSIEEIIRARSNVYMGVFGGGSRIHESMYRVSDMVPVLNLTVEAGWVPQSYADLVSAKPKNDTTDAPSFLGPWEITGERTSIRVDDLFRVTNPSAIMANVKDALKTVADHQAGVQANRDGRKNDTDEKKSDVANMMGLETIAAGVPFHFCLDLDKDISEAQLGLLLMGLADLFRENAFGGWTRCGFGKVRVQGIDVAYNGDTFSWENFYERNGEFSLPEQAKVFTCKTEEEIAALKVSDVAPFFTDFSAGAKAAKKAETKAKKAIAP